jgi:intracellular septation protein A
MSATAPAVTRVHPLVHAGRWLLSDLLSALAFAGLYGVTHNLIAATTLGIGLGVLQVLWFRLRRRPVDIMQWTSLGLVVVFGSASLLTRDPRFVMIKPTLIYAAVGAAMLKPRWMSRYMPPVVLERSADVVLVFGYVWSVLMFATGAINLLLAWRGGLAAWALFLGVFPPGTKFALITVQYLTTRIVTRSRVKAAREPVVSGLRLEQAV